MAKYVDVKVSNTIKARLKELMKVAPEKVEKAQGVVALRMIRDFVMETPKMPVLTGNMRGSGAVFVNDKKVADSKSLGENKGTPPQTNDSPEKMTVLAVINTPYAARLDQNLTPEGNMQLGPFSAQDGGVGGGFVSKKVASKRYQTTWTKILAKSIADFLK